MAPQLAAQWLKFTEELGEAPRLAGSLEDTLKGWGRLMGKLMSLYKFPPPDETVKTEDFDLGNFRVRIYTPEIVEDGRAPGVYFPGGGWVMGGVDQEDHFCRQLSRNARMQFVSVGYRLAPQSKFPAALDDGAYAAIWALSHFQVPQVVLMGTSSGGNIAFSTALKMIDQGNGDAVKGVVALAPVTVHPKAVPDALKPHYTAYEENTDITINTASAMHSWFDAYGADPEDPYLSVLLHEKLKGLKKVYITEGGADTLRDDARLMKEALEQAGVSVMHNAYPGYPHYSWLFPSKFLAEHQREFYGGLFKGIHWVSE
ncbi:hypothetical protein SUNI508_00312 [Seiridium unicorne]|uniref:Alpha/beta hydrolase fold-3 domain-containing protein n=1 Tax=Seiridium unicorne TaxID=138068 RepID=A0ABR2VIL2_9PEZI